MTKTAEQTMLEIARREYAAYMHRAARFGVEHAAFNARVLARCHGTTPTPHAWVTNAYHEVMIIAGRKCCPKATGRACMCEESLTCPDHGVRCYGSHH